jgi:hypothetical protein
VRTTFASLAYCVEDVIEINHCDNLSEKVADSFAEFDYILAYCVTLLLLQLYREDLPDTAVRSCYSSY